MVNTCNYSNQFWGIAINSFIYLIATVLLKFMYIYIVGIICFNLSRPERAREVQDVLPAGSRRLFQEYSQDYVYTSLQLGYGGHAVWEQWRFLPGKFW